MAILLKKVGMKMSELSPQERQEKLKELMLRLHAGEDEKIIQEEFNQYFDTITPFEIQVMERNLMQEGITYEEIMRLCNIHASLMSAKVENSQELPDFEQEGHPVMVLKKENLAIRGALDRIERLLTNYFTETDEALAKGINRQIALLDEFENHYLRKEYAFFPVMEAKGITAPPKVMWGVHDQIRELYQDFKNAWGTSATDTLEKFKIVQTELLEMIFKEEQILIPMIAQAFHADDWQAVAQESKQYGYCIVTPEKEWELTKVETVSHKTESASENQVPLSVGSVSIEQLDLILNLLPLELSYIDENNIVRYYNEGNGHEKIFKRTPSAIGRDVMNCHPPKSHALVQALMDQLRTGEREKEEMWMKRGDKMIHITYHAVVDKAGNYRGVLEYVQDIQPLVKHFEESDIKRHLS